MRGISGSAPAASRRAVRPPLGAPEVFLVAGTRPEAVKLAPVALALSAGGRLRPTIVASGQHPDMVGQALDAFGLRPDVSLSISRNSGTQAELCARIITRLDGVLAERNPAAVLVQGDTTTALAGALSAFWRRVPVVHLEAGLRSFDLTAPFPEEANRRLIGQVCALHLAPTPGAVANLAAEGITGGKVLAIGNTVVDAVLDVAHRRHPYRDDRLIPIEYAARTGLRRVLVVTAHRRESWGEPLERILDAVQALVDTHPDIEVVLPAHPNPRVRRQVDEALGHLRRVTVTEPLPYPDMARLLSVATLVLSDSGGIQEEAPTFGVPVLVLREVTERMEAVEAGCARLVGTDTGLILAEANRLLADGSARAAMSGRGNPFGDGRSAVRVEQALARLLGLSDELVEQFESPVHADRRTGSLDAA